MRVNATDITGFFTVGHYYKVIADGRNYGPTKCTSLSEGSERVSVDLMPIGSNYIGSSAWLYDFNTSEVDVTVLTPHEFGCIFRHSVMPVRFIHLGRRL